MNKSNSGKIIAEIDKVFNKRLAVNQKELSEILGISTTTIENYRKDGLIEFIKTGVGKRARVMFTKVNVLDFIEKNTKVAL